MKHTTQTRVTEKIRKYHVYVILQQKKPSDFVISTGKQTTVKNFVNLVAKKLEIKITWKGKGINEKTKASN